MTKPTFSIDDLIVLAGHKDERLFKEHLSYTKEWMDDPALRTSLSYSEIRRCYGQGWPPSRLATLFFVQPKKVRNDEPEITINGTL